MTNYLCRVPGSLMSAVLVVAAASLAGCSSFCPPCQQAKQDSSAVTPPNAQSGTGVEQQSLSDADKAGKTGYYRVKPGDTIRRIAVSENQNWRDIVRWNNLTNPNKIVVGQMLRVAAPGQVSAMANQNTSSDNPCAVQAMPPVSPDIKSTGNIDGVDFMWPAKGSVLDGFNGAENKGINIGGSAGDPVYAAADGVVVYAGANLPKYGELIVIKHKNGFLTAYAHNQMILVKENQAVRKGDKIAEMGSTDADLVALHFEIRRLGIPVNPVQYLPAI